VFPLRNSSDIIDSGRFKIICKAILHFTRVIFGVLISADSYNYLKVSTLYLFSRGRGYQAVYGVRHRGTSLTDRIGVLGHICSFCKCASRRVIICKDCGGAKRCLRAMRFVVSHPSRKYKRRARVGHPASYLNYYSISILLRHE